MGVTRLRSGALFACLALVASGCRSNNPVIEGPVPTSVPATDTVPESTPAVTNTTSGQEATPAP